MFVRPFLHNSRSYLDIPFLLARLVVYFLLRAFYPFSLAILILGLCLCMLTVALILALIGL